jgi:hypothetical protein
MAKVALLAAALVLAGIVYLVLLLESPGADLGQERTLGVTGAGEPELHIYLELIGVDAIRDAMQVRVSIEPIGSVTDAAFTLGRDMALVLVHDKRAEWITLPAHQPLPTTTVELELHGGDITSYPLDAYRAGLWIRCIEPPALPGLQPRLLPISVTIWERVLGFRLNTREEAGSSPGEKRLAFDMRRSRAFVFFAIAAYGAMAMLACGALAIGALAFLRVRRPEPTLVGALSAIVFALPALRNALPGGPPLGVLCDVFVFLWAELVAVFALMLLIVTWARTGSRP